MHTGEKLTTALEAAYKAFASMACPTHLEASPLRDAVRILRTLTSVPLRELTSEQIGPYAGWAITTVGSERDYRHFLPRILELAVEDASHLGLMPPVVGSRIVKGNWTAWPDEQRGAVLEVFRAAFEWSIKAHPDDTQDAPGWLCGLACLGESVDTYLEYWRTLKSENAALQLASFASLTLNSMLETGSLLEGFWEQVDMANRQAVGAWLRSPETLRLLEAALSDAHTSDRWMIEAAIKVLRRTFN